MPEPEEEICAGGFVCHAGKVLALQRWNGIWLAPKGHVDPGETAAAAALREVREEAGIDAVLGPKLGETAYTHWEGGHRHRKRVHWFLMRAETAEVELEEGVFTAHRWLGRDELDVFSFPHDRALAHKALEIALKKMEG